MFRTKTGPKLSIPATKKRMEIVESKWFKGGDAGIYNFLQCLLRQIAQALIIYLTIRLPQSG